MSDNPCASYLFTKFLAKDKNNVKKMLEAIPDVMEEILREASDLKPNREEFCLFRDLIKEMSPYDERAKELSVSEPWVVYSMFFNLWVMGLGSFAQESDLQLSETYYWSSNPIKMVLVLDKWTKKYGGKGYKAPVTEIQIYNNNTLSVYFKVENLLCTKTRQGNPPLVSYAFEHLDKTILHDVLWYNYVRAFKSANAVKNGIKEEEVAA